MVHANLNVIDDPTWEKQAAVDGPELMEKCRDERASWRDLRHRRNDTPGETCGIDAMSLEISFGESAQGHLEVS